MPLAPLGQQRFFARNISPGLITLVTIFLFLHKVWHGEVAIRDAASKSFMQTYITGWFFSFLSVLL